MKLLEALSGFQKSSALPNTHSSSFELNHSEKKIGMTSSGLLLFTAPIIRLVFGLINQFFQPKKYLINSLQRIIKGAGLRKVVSGLKMLFEPI